MNQPLAFVHPQAKIANNVVVEPFVTIYKNVEIGEENKLTMNKNCITQFSYCKLTVFFICFYSLFDKKIDIIKYYIFSKNSCV